MTVNELRSDGMRRLKIVGDDVIQAEHCLRILPLAARERVTLLPGKDDLLNLFSLEATFPVYGAFDVAIHSPMKFRRLMFIHHSYAGRVSECIYIAKVEFFAGARFAPMYAFVQSLPKGAEDGMVVHGCILLAAEWMPSNCVAVGGCDVG